MALPALQSVASAALNTPSPYSYISSYLAERADDAATAIKGIVGGAGSSRYLDAQNDSVTLIRSLLDSSNEEDRLQGLTRVVAVSEAGSSNSADMITECAHSVHLRLGQLITKGRDAKSFLPLVLKLTSSPSLSVRKLVYIVLQRYAPSSPDVALLSINSFQRDLSDASPLIRGMALRALAALRVTAAAPITLLAVAKACRDSSPYVRKIAALAILKCYELDSSSLPSLLEHLRALLNDRSPFVLGAALWTFTSLPVAATAARPTSDSQESHVFVLIHPHFRKICHALLDMDAWGQVNALDLLGRYARSNFCKPAEDGAMDKDLALLLAKANPLLSSDNVAVVMSTARLFFYCAPTLSRSVIIAPILRLLHASSAEQYLVLQNVHQLALLSPEMFAPYMLSFLPRSADSALVSILKMDMLVLLCAQVDPRSVDSSSKGWRLALTEVAEGARSPSPLVACAAVRSLGALAQKLPISADAVLRTLLRLVQARGTRSYIAEESLQIIKALLQGREDRVQQRNDASGYSPIVSDDAGTGENTAAIVAKLSHMLFGTTSTVSRSEELKKGKMPRVQGRDAISGAHARSCLYWLVGQFCRLPLSVRLRSTGEVVKTSIAEAIAPDLVRRAAINFTKESSAAKLQILTLSTKLSAFLPTIGDRQDGLTQTSNAVSTVATLHAYILQLARYDADFDVRDRGRFCKAVTDSLAEVVDEILPEAGEGSRPPGVKLRREQVLHVLFAGKPIPALLGSQRATVLLEQLSEAEHEKGAVRSPLSSLSLAFGGRLVPGWKEASLEPWRAQSTPASLRQPEDSTTSLSKLPAGVSAGTMDTRRVADALAASTARSFSSEKGEDGFASDSAQLAVDAKVSTLGGAGRDRKALAVVLDSTGGDIRTGVATKRTYKDLETFLDEPNQESEGGDEEESDDESDAAGESGEETDEEDTSEEEESVEQSGGENKRQDDGQDEDEDEDEDEDDDASQNAVAGPRRTGLATSRPNPSITLPVHENEWAT